MVTELINPATVDIDICTCTFRRVHLEKTLESLAGIYVRPHWHVRVIVSDNDETPSARPIVETFQSNFPFPITYVHAPARNISVARNACLTEAKATYIAYIDDDELAEPQWLTALIDMQEQTKADAVLGPVEAYYPAGCPLWLRDGDFHSIKPVWVNGKIITGYTSNALFLRWSPALRDLRFDPKMGRSGGEDTLFFDAIHKAGGSIQYAPNAVIIENVTSKRLSFLWLFKRIFRTGQTHGTLLLAERGAGPVTRLTNIAVALTKAIYCGLASIFAALTGGCFRGWLLRGTLHGGVIARMFGATELTQYG